MDRDILEYKTLRGLNDRSSVLWAFNWPTNFQTINLATKVEEPSNKLKAERVDSIKIGEFKGHPLKKTKKHIEAASLTYRFLGVKVLKVIKRIRPAQHLALIQDTNIDTMRILSIFSNPELTTNSKLTNVNQNSKIPKTELAIYCARRVPEKASFSSRLRSRQLIEKEKHTKKGNVVSQSPWHDKTSLQYLP